MFYFFQNTFILKRKWPPNLYKKNSSPDKLRGRHHVYELVNDTSVQKKPNLDVVLTSFVDGIGDKGDIVSLKPSVAYNKLLLNNLAVYKTPENVEKYAKSEEEKEIKLHSSPYAQRTVNMLNILTLAVVMNKTEPWTVEKWHIKTAFRKVGYHVPIHAITLPNQAITGPDLTKQNKEFTIKVTVNNLETAFVKCRIHHWSTDPSERLPYVFEHWKEPAERLIEDEQF